MAMGVILMKRDFWSVLVLDSCLVMVFVLLTYPFPILASWPVILPYFLCYTFCATLLDDWLFPPRP